MARLALGRGETKMPDTIQSPADFAAARCIERSRGVEPCIAKTIMRQEMKRAGITIDQMIDALTRARARLMGAL